MRVFAETNFVLELALQQEGAEACSEFIALARTGTITLIIPAYSMVEPHETMTRRHRSRADLQQRVSREITQLRRTGDYASATDQLDGAASLFARSVQDEQARLRAATQEIQEVGELVPLTSEIIVRGNGFQDQFGLMPQDSFVLATVVHRLEVDSAEESIFVTRNSKDFDDPDITEMLAGRACRAMWHFDHALMAVRSVIS